MHFSDPDGHISDIRIGFRISDFGSHGFRMYGMKVSVAIRYIRGFAVKQIDWPIYSLYSRCVIPDNTTEMIVICEILYERIRFCPFSGVVESGEKSIPTAR